MEEEPKPIRKRTDLVLWGTESEKNYIANIGTYCKSKSDRGETKEERRMRFLLNYRISIFNRKDWGNIIVGEILTYVDRWIIACRGRLDEERPNEVQQCAPEEAPGKQS